MNTREAASRQNRQTHPSAATTRLSGEHDRGNGGAIYPQVTAEIKFQRLNLLATILCLTCRRHPIGIFTDGDCTRSFSQMQRCVPVYRKISWPGEGIRFLMVEFGEYGFPQRQ